MKVNIKKLPESQSENAVYLSKDIMDVLMLTVDNNYTVSFGQLSRQLKVSLYMNFKSKSTIYLPVDIFNGFFMNEDFEADLYLSKNGNLKIGPVIGVFVNDRYIDSIIAQNAPASAMNMIKANQYEKAVVYYFSAKNVRWLDKKVKGWYFSESKKKWITSWVPFPDVVYDRGVNFLAEEKSLIEHFRKQIRLSSSIARINSVEYLDKWWCYWKISKNAAIQPYLPETIRYKSIDDLRYALDKYDVVYLKSFYGSRGSEIMTVSKIPDGKFQCFNFDNNNPRVIETGDISTLINIIDGFFKGKKIIIQQGIDKFEFKGRHIDMRVLIQKDGSGRWLSIYNQVRVGKSEIPVTNVSKGGKVYDFPDSAEKLIEIDAKSAKKLDEEIRSCAIKVAEAIEKEYGALGEIGMDMALDKNLNVWFIEANSKPDKDPEPGIEDETGPSRQFLLTIEYARFLWMSMD